MLGKNPETIAKLTPLVSLFERLTTEAIEILFQQSCQRRDPWKISERPMGTFDHIMVIGNSNDDYQASFVTGIQKDAIQPFFGYEIAIDEAIDGLSEFGNTLCGMVMDQEEFYKEFGILKNSPPIVSEEQVFLPRATTVDGKLYFSGDHWIYCAYAIRPLSFMQIKPQSQA